MERYWAFTGGDAGEWRVTSLTPVIGAAVQPVSHIAVLPLAVGAPAPPGRWTLRGVRSNERYVSATERSLLVAKQADLGRSEARSAALIPIRKSPGWWALAQDERRAIMEERSHHIAIGFEYLPAIARRLYHCRDLDEPFDFLTWFEFAPQHSSAFDDLLARLRASYEWTYIEHEVEVRLERAG